MSVFLSSAVIISSLSLLIYLFLRDAHYKRTPDSRSKFIPWVFLLETLAVVTDLCAGGNTYMRLPLDLAVTLFPLMGILSSVWDDDVVEKLVYAGLVMQCLLVVHHGLVAVHVIGQMTVPALRISLFAMSLTYPLMYILSLWYRIRDVKAVMKSGTVWLSLCLSVESIYVMSALLNIYAFLAFFSFMKSPLASLPTVLLLGLETFAIGLRETFESVFVLMNRHERRIVESLKVSHVEVANDAAKDDPQYMDIYERVVAYFEKERPYLNSELTVNDIVKVVFTNKLYISKAISQYTGRNFCQFVNYYRVTHSVNVFRDNPEMKVVELASACGFNSVVSFNMAFRLFMNENPSDWCRKERSRLIKGKNKLWNR